MGQTSGKRGQTRLFAKVDFKSKVQQRYAAAVLPGSQRQFIEMLPGANRSRQ